MTAKEQLKVAFKQQVKKIICDSNDADKTVHGVARLTVLRDKLNLIIDEGVNVLLKEVSIRTPLK